MKNKYVSHDSSQPLYVISYGTESVAAKARWGRGCRDVTILHYVLSGEGYYNGTRLGAGQGFFIPRGKLHEYHAAQDTPWSYFWVILGGSDADETVQRYVAADENGIFSYDFRTALMRFVGDLFTGDTGMTAAKGMGTFWLLMACHEKEPSPGANKYVDEAKRFMQQNIHRPLTVREVAEALYISDRYLYNLFVAHEGLCPKQYLNSLRLKRACTLLENQANSVTEVAVSVGFPDVLTFSKFFSKHMGVSPSKYKQELQK